MRKILFIVIFNIYGILFLNAQSICEIKAFADDQFKKTNYSTALKEYQRVHFFDTTSLYDDIYLKIASIYYNQSDFRRAIEYFNLAWYSEQKDSVRNEITFRKATCYLKLEEYLVALNELFDIPQTKSEYFDAKLNLYFAISYYGLDDLVNAQFYFSQFLGPEGRRDIDIIFVDFERFKRKYKPRKIELMSKFIPGLGQLKLGNFGSGINSFLLVGGAVSYAAYTASAYGLIDGALLLSSFYRYYLGGANQAKVESIKKIREEKRRTYLEIMSLIDKNESMQFLH